MRWAFTVLLAALVTSALAEGINDGAAFLGGSDGVFNPLGHNSPPPSSCNGTIDLSTGCVQPMLGGL